MRPLGVLPGLFLVVSVRVRTIRTWTPQGAVISSLPADLYVHSVDLAMEKAKCVMVRYAGDLVVLCRTRQEAE